MQAPADPSLHYRLRYTMSINPSLGHFVLAALALAAAAAVFVPFFVTCKDEMVWFGADSPTALAAARAAASSAGAGCRILGLPQLDNASMAMEIAAMASSGLSVVLLLGMLVYYSGPSADPKGGWYMFALWSTVALSAAWWVLKAVRFGMADSDHRNYLALISMGGGLLITAVMAYLATLLSYRSF